MVAQRYMAEVQPDGTLSLPQLELAPGTAVEVIIVSSGSLEELEPAETSFQLSRETLAEVWAGPEEDEAWAALQQAM
jgi:hypothetical protein